MGIFLKESYPIQVLKLRVYQLNSDMHQIIVGCSSQVKAFKNNDQ